MTFAKQKPMYHQTVWERLVQGDWFRWFCRVFLAVWIIIQVVPLLYVLSVSLSRAIDVNNTILYVLPRRPTLVNYQAIFEFFDRYLVSFPRLLLNNSIYALGGVLGALLLASLASFAFATMEFWGKQLIFYGILLALIMPTSMLMIPERVTLKFLGLLGGYHSVILPYVAFGLPLPILILTTFFRELPGEIFDSAKVDGCNDLRLWWHIAMPMARPALASIVIYLFLYFWNEFPLALIAVQKAEFENIPMALAGLTYGRSQVVPWELLATAIVTSSLPVTLVFALFQAQLVEGLSEGALKG